MSRRMRALSSALVLILVLAPSGRVLASDVLRVHETHGLFMEKWGVREAVSRLSQTGSPKAEWTQSYYSEQRHENRLIGFPRNREELYRQRIIVLNNVPAKAVPSAVSMMLEQYVADGGCIVMMGDTDGPALGHWTDDVLEPLLPIDLKQGVVRLHSPQALPIQPGEAAGIKGLDWKRRPCTFYYYKAVLRPGAKVLLKSGGTPLAVEKRTGRGRIIVLLASVLGEKQPGSDDLAFWEWEDWAALMAQFLTPLKGR